MANIEVRKKQGKYKRWRSPPYWRGIDSRRAEETVKRYNEKRNKYEYRVVYEDWETPGLHATVKSL